MGTFEDRADDVVFQTLIVPERNMFIVSRVNGRVSLFDMNTCLRTHVLNSQPPVMTSLEPFSQ